MSLLSLTHNGKNVLGFFFLSHRKLRKAIKFLKFENFLLMTGFQYSFTDITDCTYLSLLLNMYSLYKTVTWDTAAQTETMSALLKIDRGHFNSSL